MRGWAPRGRVMPIGGMTRGRVFGHGLGPAERTGGIRNSCIRQRAQHCDIIATAAVALPVTAKGFMRGAIPSTWISAQGVPACSLQGADVQFEPVLQHPWPVIWVLGRQAWTFQLRWIFAKHILA